MECVAIVVALIWPSIDSLVTTWNAIRNCWGYRVNMCVNVPVLTLLSSPLHHSRSRRLRSVTPTLIPPDRCLPGLFLRGVTGIIRKRQGKGTSCHRGLKQQGD